MCNCITIFPVFLFMCYLASFLPFICDHVSCRISRLKWPVKAVPLAQAVCLSVFRCIRCKMAARRVANSAIDWAEFAKKIPEASKPAFNAFKNKQDGVVRRISVLPHQAPKIDFAQYKAKIAVAGNEILLEFT